MAIFTVHGKLANNTNGQKIIQFIPPILSPSKSYSSTTFAYNNIGVPDEMQSVDETVSNILLFDERNDGDGRRRSSVVQDVTTWNEHWRTHWWRVSHHRRREELPGLVDQATLQYQNVPRPVMEMTDGIGGRSGNGDVSVATDKDDCYHAGAAETDVVVVEVRRSGGWAWPVVICSSSSSSYRDVQNTTTTVREGRRGRVFEKFIVQTV